MGNISREQVFADLKAILNELNDEWEYSGEISLDTWLSTDMGFESIDVVAFGTAIEEHYRQSFPFAEFLTELGRREVEDLRVSDVVDFVYQNLDSHSR